ncbi:MAG: ABC transporter permease [Cyclobacteriaceae bacterium]
MNDEKTIPPLLAQKLLKFFIREDLAEEVLGDLQEKFYQTAESKSVFKAKLNYWYQTLNYLRPFALNKLSSNRSNHMSTFQHNFKIGWRSLLKHKTHSSINVLGLTVGLTSFLIIFLFVKYEFSFDRSAPFYDRTYRVVQHTKSAEQTLYWNTTAYPLAKALKDDFPEIDIVTQAAGPVTRTFSSEYSPSGKVHFEQEGVLFVDPDYAKVFDIEWLEGSPQTALTEMNSVVLTESVFKKCFGIDDQSTGLGKTIFLNNKNPLIVSGIIKDAPGNSNLRYSMLVPYEFFKKHNPYFTSNWSGNYQGTTFLVLNDANQKDEIESKISTWKKKYLKPEDDSRISYVLQPLSELHIESLYGGPPDGYIIQGKILTSVVVLGIFMLLIAIANFVNLVTAHSSTRLKEVGIRKIVGSSRMGLVKQFSIENAILVFAAICVSGILAKMLIVELNEYLTIIDLRLEFGLAEITMLAAVGIVTTLLAVIYPSTILSKYRPIRALQGRQSANRKEGLFVRRFLTTFQFCVVQLFVFAAAIVGLQLNHLKSNELGFSSEAIVSVSVPDQNKSDVFVNTLLQNGNVQKIAFGSGPPMAVDNFRLGTNFRLPHQSMEESQESEMKIGNLDYLDFYDLKLVAGRNITMNKMNFDEFIVNEKLVKSMNWTIEEALGQKIRINEGVATIVGVVEDFHNQPLQYEITPCIFMNWSHFLNKAFIKVNHFNSDVLADIESVWASQFPSSVFNYNFLDESIEKEYAIENLIFDGIKVFSTLVLLVGCLGLLGLMSFTVKLKTKEIGIRKVLGATFIQILSLLSKELVLLILVASCLVIPIVYHFMGLWLQNFVYRIELSGWIFVISGLSTLLFAMVISLFHSTKAALANPVDSIRNE